MERGKIRMKNDDILQDYYVEEAEENDKWYYGIIQNVEVKKDNIRINGTLFDQYHILITIVIDTEDGQESYYQTYKDVTLKGRPSFQEFAERFNLVSWSTNGISCLYLDELPGQICQLSINQSNTRILPVTNRKTIQEMKSLFADVEIGSIDLASLPSTIKYYTIIPLHGVTGICDYFNHNIGMIQEISVKPEPNDEDDYMLILTVAIINNEQIIRYKKYFNNIFTSGKAELDAFFLKFNVVDEKCNPNIELLNGKHCTATLYQSRSGRIYIRNILPLIVNGKSSKKQYKDWIYYHFLLNL